MKEDTSMMNSHFLLISLEKREDCVNDGLFWLIPLKNIATLFFANYNITN